MSCPEGIYDIIKFGLTNEAGNFTYIILKLQSEYNLAFYGMLLPLCIFSIFIIHSIFSISVSKRSSEYGIMETLGISGMRIGGTLILELWLLLLFGYPSGCLLGNGFLKLFYQQLNRVFTVKGTGNAVFHTAWNAIAAGFVFLLTALAIAGFSTVRFMHRQSLRQVINGDSSFIKRRHIYSFRNPNLAHVIVRKFMFPSRRRVIGILLSLPLGGCIFLCSAYMVENLKVHAEMSLKSDDGLGSDYRVSIKWDILSDTIPAQTVTEIKKTAELSEVYATRYTLGELTIQKRELEWDKYFDQMNKSSYFVQRFGGICVQKEDGSYGIKYNIYGYDTGLLEQLQEFEIAAIVSRPLARETSFLNADSWSSMQSLILPNRQMYEQYGIYDYSFINASAADETDTDIAADRLLQKIQDVPKAVLQDYTTAIETQKSHLRQQQLFFSGIALILLVISLFHIMNSMNYSILSHRREYGIIRAMGITDAGFYNMVLRMGFLYGLLADLLIFLLYNLFLRRVMDYYMIHVIQFLHIGMTVPREITGSVMVLNILIAVAAVSFCIILQFFRPTRTSNGRSSSSAILHSI